MTRTDSCQILSIIIERISERSLTMDRIQETESLQAFKDVSEEILDNLYITKSISQNVFDPHIIQAAKEDAKKFLATCDFDVNKMVELLQSRHWSDDKVQCFASLLEEKKSELLCATLVAHSSKYGETITDFDWILKLVLGTSNLKTLTYPLLQLIMTTVNSEGEEKKQMFDMNKEMLAKLINQLENVVNDQ